MVVPAQCYHEDVARLRAELDALALLLGPKPGEVQREALARIGALVKEG
jgi:hypothetical protein